MATATSTNGGNNGGDIGRAYRECERDVDSDVEKGVGAVLNDELAGMYDRERYVKESRMVPSLGCHIQIKSAQIPLSHAQATKQYLILTLNVTCQNNDGADTTEHSQRAVGRSANRVVLSMRMHRRKVSECYRRQRGLGVNAVVEVGAETSLLAAVDVVKKQVASQV